MSGLLKASLLDLWVLVIWTCRATGHPGARRESEAPSPLQWGVGRTVEGPHAQNEGPTHSQH